MFKKIFESKFTKFSVLLYLIFVTLSVFYGYTCHSGLFCGLWVIAPALPWFFLFGSPKLVNPLPSDGQLSITLWVVGILINLIIAYFIGFLLQAIVRRWRKIP